MTIEREIAHRRSEACASARDTTAPISQECATFQHFGRSNVAKVRHKQGKIAKSLSCNDIKFNIIHIMTLSPDPAPNRCRDPRFDPPPLRSRAGAKAHDPFTHPEKNFPQIHATGVLTHERTHPPR